MKKKKLTKIEKHTISVLKPFCGTFKGSPCTMNNGAKGEDDILF